MGRNLNSLVRDGLKQGYHFVIQTGEINRTLALVTLEGVVKPRQLRSLLPLELKDVNKIRVRQQPKPKKLVAAAAVKCSMGAGQILNWRSKSLSDETVQVTAKLAKLMKL